MTWPPNPTRAAKGHMPFPGHRTQAEVRQDEEAAIALRKLSEAAKREVA